MYIINRRDWELLQRAKLLESGDLAPLPFSDPDDDDYDYPWMKPGVPGLLEEEG